MTLTPVLQSRPQQVAAAIVLVVMFAIGFIPLFGGPGYEHALATGLLVPGAAAVATALDLSKAEGASPLACVCRGILSGLVLALLSLATALVHGLWFGLCDLPGDFLYFALTAGAGSVMGGAWGAVVAEVSRRRKRRRLASVLLALAAPLGCVIVGVWRFYSSPMIFSYDPFVGYFSGTLYDTVIDAGPALLTYRIGSVATLVGLLALASVMQRDANGRLWFVDVRRDAGAAARALVATSLLATSVGITLAGAKLDHWQTSSTIARALGGFRAGTRCDAVFPDSLRPDEAAMLVKDCEEELESVETALGSRGPDKITAFFFRDSGEKKRLMGAADTYIAKPWRHEVYLQLSSYPHPVLGHELAHVVAGSFGRGAFRVAGPLGGLWPNPGLIEGVAVAASPDDDELTDAQWAKAMLDIGILPPMKSVFSVDFLGQNSSKSYTVAGAFVRWILDREGSSTVRAWYGGESIETLTKKSWAELDAEFRKAISEEKFSPEAGAFAKAKFDRPSVFGRKCPHVVDALKREAGRCEDAHEIDRAVTLYDDVLVRDPHDFGARYRRGAAELRYGDAARGRTELRALEGDASVPRTWRDKCEETLADDELLSGDFEAAARHYRALATRTVDEDAGRTLEVKALAATNLPARRAVAALLIGSEGRPADPWLGAIYLGTWSELERDTIADYLIGKNLAQHGFYTVAAPYLDRALAGDATTARIGREILRMRAVCACAMGDAPGVARVRALVSEGGSPFHDSVGGRLESVLRLLSRCR